MTRVFFYYIINILMIKYLIIRMHFNYFNNKTYNFLKKYLNNFQHFSKKFQENLFFMKFNFIQNLFSI